MYSSASKKAKLSCSTLNDKEVYEPEWRLLEILTSVHEPDVKVIVQHRGTLQTESTVVSKENLVRLQGYEEAAERLSLPETPTRKSHQMIDSPALQFTPSTIQMLDSPTKDPPYEVSVISPFLNAVVTPDGQTHFISVDPLFPTDLEPVYANISPPKDVEIPTFLSLQCSKT